MSLTLLGLLAVLGMFLGMLLLLEIGRRLGLIRLNAFDQALVDVRQSMNP
jgi:hypothetical protein